MLFLVLRKVRKASSTWSLQHKYEKPNRNTDSSKRLKLEISDTKKASVSSFLHVLFLVTFLGLKFSGKVILLGCCHLN